ncbi:hypothetical protein ACVITL_002677 [Rhizobium pisi]
MMRVLCTARASTLRAVFKLLEIRRISVAESSGVIDGFNGSADIHNGAIYGQSD